MLLPASLSIDHIVYTCPTPSRILAIPFIRQIILIVMALWSTEPPRTDRMLWSMVRACVDAMKEPTSSAAKDLGEY